MLLLCCFYGCLIAAHVLPLVLCQDKADRLVAAKAARCHSAFADRCFIASVCWFRQPHAVLQACPQGFAGVVPGCILTSSVVVCMRPLAGPAQIACSIVLCVTRRQAVAEEQRGCACMGDVPDLGQNECACAKFVRACISSSSVSMQLLMVSSGRRFRQASLVLEWSLQGRQLILLPKYLIIAIPCRDRAVPGISHVFFAFGLPRPSAVVAVLCCVRVAACD